MFTPASNGERSTRQNTGRLNVRQAFGRLEPRKKFYTVRVRKTAALMFFLVVLEALKNLRPSNQSKLCNKPD